MAAGRIFSFSFQYDSFGFGFCGLFNDTVSSSLYSVDRMINEE
jgi:hypothetical protein